jgi:hypothetical protein
MRKPDMKHRIYLLVALCWFVWATVGCATPPGRITADLPGRYIPLTRPILAVGDTQEHNATGFPLHQEDGAVDTYVEVAQRPPEQPLFGRRLLEWAIQRHLDMPLLHLGDVVDMSCQTEWVRMRRIFETGGQPKVILPGNHDGLLFGIFNHDLLTDYLTGDVLEWQRGCRQTSEADDIPPSSDGKGPALNKRMFLQKYIEFQAAGPNYQFGLKSAKKLRDLRDIQLAWINPDQEGFVEKVDANLVFGRNYATSFIVQKLRLPPVPDAPRRVTVVGVDTSQLSVAVGVLNMLAGESPGDTGRVLDGQAKIIETYVQEAQRAGEIVIFAGHHSWNQLDVGSRNRLAKIMEPVDNPLVYISAHTHEGWWAMHRLGNRSLLELNVSSLADWPIAYRRLAFAYDPAAKRIKVSADLMPMIDSPPRSDQEILDAWVRQTCAEVEVPLKKIARRDYVTVNAQRESRGSLFDWAFSSFEGVSDAARLSLYEHAHSYIDGLLDVIMSTHGDLGGQVPELEDVTVPNFCVAGSVKACAAALLTMQHSDLATSVESYREKAFFAYAVGEQWDEIQDPRAKAYMTCRAAIAAKDDFDMTPEDKRPGTTEERRRGRDFFRVEATVGMD